MNVDYVNNQSAKCRGRRDKTRNHYRRSTVIDHRTAAYGAFVLRVALGLAALSHGLLKLLVFTPAGTVAFFASLGYPAPLAWAVMLVEVVGGVALILGVYARIVAVVQIPILLGALLVHLPNGWMFANANGGWEYPLFWAAGLVTLALVGPGAFALREVPSQWGQASPRLA
jgi:putative oxidoreductase